MAEALKFIKYSKDKGIISDVLGADKEFEHLDRRTVEVINEVTGSDIRIPEGAKEVNMCKAIQDMKKDAERHLFLWQ